MNIVYKVYLSDHDKYCVIHSLDELSSISKYTLRSIKLATISEIQYDLDNHPNSTNLRKQFIFLLNKLNLEDL